MLFYQVHKRAKIIFLESKTIFATTQLNKFFTIILSPILIEATRKIVPFHRMQDLVL